MKHTPTIFSITHIVELGTATTLTLGGCSNSMENFRPAPLYKKHKNQIELGKATSLTLGSGTKLFEGPDGRPARS
jgi:hypothetical protein